MLATAEHTFFDGFFYGVSVIVFFLVAIDWWIGPKGRRAMRDKTIEWWNHIDDLSFTGLAAEDAGKVRRGFEAVFGKRWYGFRAILLTFLLSVVVTHLCFWLGHSIVQWELYKGFYEANSHDYPDNYPVWYIYALERGYESLFDMDTYYPTIGRFLPLNAIADLASLYLTIYLLSLMETSTRAVRLTAIIVVDILIIFVLTSIVFDIGLRTTWLVHPNYLADTYYLVKEPMLLFSTSLFYEYTTAKGGLGFLLAKMALLSLFFSSALPTIIHLFITSIFLVSKVLSPMLKPIISRILERFSDSDKGVFTQIAIGGGAAAKVVQEGIKLLT